MSEEFISVEKMKETLRDAESDSKSKMLGDWSMINDHVHSREYVASLFEAGKITRSEAEEMLRMRYVVAKDGTRQIEIPYKR